MSQEPDGVADASRATRPKVKASHAEVAASLEKLGGNIRHARVARDLTLEELAQRVGVQPATLGRLERGAPGVSIETLALVLWHMNLLPLLTEVAHPHRDAEGERLASMRSPSRPRSQIPSKGWGALKQL